MQPQSNLAISLIIWVHINVVNISNCAQIYKEAKVCNQISLNMNSNVSRQMIRAALCIHFKALYSSCMTVFISPKGLPAKNKLKHCSECKFVCERATSVQ